jgi:hypothetical protein
MARNLARVGLVFSFAGFCMLISSIFYPSMLPFVKVTVREIEHTEIKSVQRVLVSNWSLAPMTIEGADVSCSCVRAPGLPVVVGRLSWHELEFEVDTQRSKGEDLKIRFYPRAPHQGFFARLSP